MGAQTSRVVGPTLVYSPGREGFVNIFFFLFFPAFPAKSLCHPPKRGSPAQQGGGGWLPSRTPSGGSLPTPRAIRFVASRAHPHQAGRDPRRSLRGAGLDPTGHRGSWGLFNGGSGVVASRAAPRRETLAPPPKRAKPYRPIPTKWNSPAPCPRPVRLPVCYC